MKDRIITFEGCAFKQSEISSIFTELGAYGVAYDEEGGMVTFNYAECRHEELSNDFVAKFLYERRYSLNLEKYNFRKCLMAAKLIRVFIKKMQRDKVDFLIEGNPIYGDSLPEARWESLA